MHIYTGTSGYSYKEWKGFFYPKDLPQDQMLQYYAERLPSVEINNTFYRFPNRGMIESWSSAVPEHFRFSVKATQKITHLKRLKNARDETEFLMKTVGLLGEKLGVVLFQCPPNFRKDLERLEEFLKTLPEGVRCAFEFRHETWFDEEVYHALREKDCALCAADTDEELKVPFVSTSKWGYLRLRRPDYSKKDLQQWLKKIGEQSWGEVFVFFKHEDEGVGAALALKMQELASGTQAQPKSASKPPKK